jgi:hypothetical protein
MSGSSWSSSWIQTTQLQAPSSPKVAIFKDGFPEEWIKWLMAFREIESLMPLKEPADKTRIFRNLLKGQALSYFEHHLRKRVRS